MASSRDIELGSPKASNQVAPGAPPAYSNGPPPDYGSWFEELKKTREDTDDNVSFGKRFCSVIVGSIGCTIGLGFMIGIPVSQIVIGTLFLNQCTIQRMIPIFLIVWGSFGVFKTLISTGERVRNHVRKNQEDDDKDKNAKPNPLDGLISLFLFAWFIAGNYWIFSVYTKVNTVDATSALYCHNTLYFFAFWMTIAMYILVGVAILIGCCCCFVCCCCCGKKGGADLEK